MNDILTIGGKEFTSRLFVGTGKFSSNRLMLESILASGSQMITVAMKRIDMDHEEEDDMLRHINREHVQFLPNTSGVRTAEEAVLAANLARDCFGTDFIKLEIHPDPKYLLPDPIETLKATEVLAGTNKGLKTRDLLEIIIEESRVPVVIDAGLGAPSHAADAMEIGADAVLVNTAIAVAGDPVEMAVAFRLAVEAGRKAYLAGLGSVSSSASATSPLTEFLNL